MGRGGVLTKLLWASALALITLGLGLASVGAAAAASGPSPDPPPVKPPPPPPRAAPPPPQAPQPPPPPPPPVYRDPGPTAAEIAAERVAAQRKARAAKLQQQRARAAEAKRLARKAERDRKLKQARDQQRLQEEREALLGGNGKPTGEDEPRRPAAGFASDGESSSKTAPLVGIAFLLALVVLTLGLVPAYLVPWYSMSMVLEEHRQQFTWVGGMAVLATGILLLMVVLGG